MSIFCKHNYCVKDDILFCQKCGKIKPIPCQHKLRGDYYMSGTLSGSKYATGICCKCGRFVSISAEE